MRRKFTTDSKFTTCTCFSLSGSLGGAKRISKKREEVPEMGTKPLKALRGYRASNRGSKGL